MTGVLGGVLRRRGVVGLAIAVALALGVYELLGAFVRFFPVVLIAKADEDMSFKVRGSAFEYAEVLTALLTLVLVAAVLALVWRFLSDETKRCPDCLSEIPLRAKVCRYCTSEVGPST
jgi:large conductance mechanosensitive channel